MFVYMVITHKSGGFCIRFYLSEDYPSNSRVAIVFQVTLTQRSDILSGEAVNYVCFSMISRVLRTLVNCMNAIEWFI